MSEKYPVFDKWGNIVGWFVPKNPDPATLIVTVIIGVIVATVIVGVLLIVQIVRLCFRYPKVMLPLMGLLLVVIGVEYYLNPRAFQATQAPQSYAQPNKSVSNETTTLTMYANRWWQDTGISLLPGDKVSISYIRGSWTFDPNTKLTKADGNSAYPADYNGRVPGAKMGALVARIGHDLPFAVDLHKEVTTEKGGDIYLAINDDNSFEDNKGSIIVEIRIEYGQQSQAQTRIKPTVAATASVTNTPLNNRPNHEMLELVGVISADRLNVRAGPGTNYDVVGKLSKNDKVKIQARNEAGDWLRISLASGTGWIATKHITLQGPVEDIPVAAPTAQ